MELQSNQSMGYNTYQVSQRSDGDKWYTKKRNIAIGGVALIFIIVGGYFAATHFSGASARSRTPDHFSPEERIKELPPVQWDNVCPRIRGKCPESFSGTPPVILVSLDGFRPDYIKRKLTPTIEKLAKCGTDAPYMYPVFPTKTFPNHYSQVTGLYPASHGIIDNNMYDPVTRKLFKVGTPESLKPNWWSKEPIWVTAQKQGKKSGCYFWPGSDVIINGSRPNYYKKYSSKTPFGSRVDQVLQWLDLPIDSRPNFMTLYVNQPDNAAHHFGIYSKEVDQSLTKVDNMIERLLAGLQQKNLINCVNIIITSDHGMSSTDCSRLVTLTDHMNMTDIYVTAGPFGRLRAKGRFNKTFNHEMVSKLSCRSEHMRAYLKEELPVRYHYADNRRIEPVFLDLDAGWTVVSRPLTNDKYMCEGGAHGYDNYFPDMRSLFLAHGPSIKRNNTIKPFLVVELYELLAELIDITGNPNNGTKGSLHAVLKSPQKLSAQFPYDPPMVGTVPKDEMEYNFRVYAANCSCQQTHKQIEVENTTALNAIHLPFGIPYSYADNNTMRLLYQEDFVSAYDLKYRLPMWTSFTLSGLKTSDKLRDICWVGDGRIPMADTSKCGEYRERIVKNQNILQRPVYPSFYSSDSLKEQALYVTNSIPKSLNHTNQVEEKMFTLLGQWAEAQGQLNVLMGGAFDVNGDGLRPEIGRLMRIHEKFGPLVVPTHIFVIATWCSNKTESLSACPSSKLEATAFLLPNHPFTHNCESAEAIITKNAARIVDVEQLTGLSFFTSLPTAEAIRLRTLIPEKIPN